MLRGEKVPKKRDRKSERAAKNKKAFNEIIGDPYAYPEPIEGHYSTLRNSSGVRVAGLEYPTSSSPVNGARPNVVDFFCDVDAAIRDGLEVFNKNDLAPSPLEKLDEIFQNTYVTEIGMRFSQQDRAVLEQHIGRILVARHISPTSKYFTTIKQ